MVKDILEANKKNFPSVYFSICFLAEVLRQVKRAVPQLAGKTVLLQVMAKKASLRIKEG